MTAKKIPLTNTGDFQPPLFREAAPVAHTKYWGIRRKDLENLPYDSLRRIFIGYHNVQIPPQMGDVLNPIENCIIYAAASQKGRSESLEGHTSFLELITAINDAGKVSLIRPSGRPLAPFQTLYTEPQTKRLARLDEAVQQEFLDSFSSPYSPPSSEVWPGQPCFYDPNIDGRSRSVYASYIFDHLKNLEKQRS